MESLFPAHFGLVEVQLHHGQGYRLVTFKVCWALQQLEKFLLNLLSWLCKFVQFTPGHDTLVDLVYCSSPPLHGALFRGLLSQEIGFWLGFTRSLAAFLVGLPIFLACAQACLHLFGHLPSWVQWTSVQYSCLPGRHFTREVKFFGE